MPQWQRVQARTPAVPEEHALKIVVVTKGYLLKSLIQAGRIIQEEPFNDRQRQTSIL